MRMTYYTDRLILTILQENSWQEVLSFYKTNRDIFEPYEPDKQKHFYTASYQKTLLNCEYNNMLKMTSMRYWVFEKNNPNKIIGTVSFSNFIKGAFESCHIGYKFDKHYHRLGFASEAVNKACSEIFHDMKIHRIEAYIHPDNYESIHFAEKNGFELECLAKDIVYLHDKWTSHYRYILTNSNL